MRNKTERAPSKHKEELESSAWGVREKERKKERKKRGNWTEQLRAIRFEWEMFLNGQLMNMIRPANQKRNNALRVQIPRVCQEVTSVPTIHLIHHWLVELYVRTIRTRVSSSPFFEPGIIFMQAAWTEGTRSSLRWVKYTRQEQKHLYWSPGGWARCLSVCLFPKVRAI